MNQQYEAFVRTRQEATHSYVGYDIQIEQLGQNVADALQRVNMLMARQGHMIEVVSINRLKTRRERLVAQQAEARYAVADSYDRAAHLESGGEGR